ncbi:hypothetical protein Q4575_12005 [Psychrosphaera sp. 1_MG-2023]|uniref:M61 family metallopeptidase n=1 Tax=Psychrosphaera sp. 1_MG-2023 TaxID=3062643 RepID=UPI0026E1C76F|nr:hypothetical protein [Psychrosphaera sp. 1_MG-2023]MDO6720131.1 hypothetical protein [Psychrosphaera sp. 1_MG-2023]
MTAVHYHIAIEDPNQHLFAIKIDITPQNSDDIKISLPNWIPGSYMIRDFAKHILDFDVSDAHGKLTHLADSKSGYVIKHNNQPFSISYHVYAFDLSVRKAYLDQEFGFINPASSLFQIDQMADQPCLVTLLPPPIELTLCKDWLPATGLTSTSNKSPFSYGDFSADSYLLLTDYPIMYGDLDIAEFAIDNVPHYLVTVGRHFGELNRVVKDLKPLCEYHAETFGGLPKDLDQYLFMTMVTDTGFGGLEHLNSTALVCSRFDIPNAEQPINEDYTTFLSLCSHEYLHTWNVKKLKPKEFTPYKLNQEVYTEQLWFYEGMTSYFDDLSLVQTGTIPQQQYLDLLAKTFTRIEKGLGQLRQSVTESSYHTWTKFYQQDHTAPDQIVSYYQKGAAIACLVDLVLIQQSQGKQSLRTLMLEAWQLFGKNGIGTTQHDLEHLFLTFLGEQHKDWLTELLYGKSKVELAPLFLRAGIEVNKFTQTDTTQTHGNAITEHKVQNWLGAVTSDKSGNLVVKQLFANSPAEKAGVAVGDELLAIDNIRLTAKNLQLVINSVVTPTSTIHYFRKDQLLSRELQLESSPAFLVQLKVKDQAKLDLWLKP